MDSGRQATIDQLSLKETKCVIPVTGVVALKDAVETLPTAVRPVLLAAIEDCRLGLVKSADAARAARWSIEGTHPDRHDYAWAQEGGDHAFRMCELGFREAAQGAGETLPSPPP
jgi:hypothetical protein